MHCDRLKVKDMPYTKNDAQDFRFALTYALPLTLMMKVSLNFNTDEDKFQAKQESQPSAFLVRMQPGKKQETSQGICSNQEKNQD